MKNVDVEVNDILKGMMAEASSMLSEYADSVQIICTKLEPNRSTTTFADGSGNIHSRVNSCRTWAKKTGSQI